MWLEGERRQEGQEASEAARHMCGGARRAGWRERQEELDQEQQPQAGLADVIRGRAEQGRAGVVTGYRPWSDMPRSMMALKLLGPIRHVLRRRKLSTINPFNSLPVCCLEFTNKENNRFPP